VVSKKIIVLDGESRQALTVVRALGSVGYKVIVGSHEKRALSFYSRFASKRVTYTHPQQNPDQFLDEIIYISKNNGADFVLPILEPTIFELSKVRDELESKGIIIPVPDFESLKLAMDKYSVYRIAKDIGIPVPKTLIVHDIYELNEASLQFNFPLVLKIPKEIGVLPWNRFAVARNLKELKSKFKRLSKFSDGIIVQEYIDGIGVGSFFLFNKFRSLITYFGHRRIFENPFSGVSIICETFLNFDTLKYGLKLLNALNWKGIAMVEFRLEKKSGIPYLLEVNPRFWGSLPLAIKAGFNFPKLLVETWAQERLRESGKDIILNDNYQNLKTKYVILSPAIELEMKRLARKQIKELLKDTTVILKEIIQNIGSTFEFDYFDYKPFLISFSKISSFLKIF